MNNTNTINCDILVIGSGFSGSLMALCLYQQGYKVCVVEKASHPRFAIGESSTPIADMILRDLSMRYNLPWLKHFSRYGTWQKYYPEVTCGLKRGFSYFKHEAGQPFQTNSRHENELLVAASINNERSDTNWLRSGFDAFLAGKLRDYGITFLDQTDITALERNQDIRWIVTAQRMEKAHEIRCSFFVDASGSPHFLQNFLGIQSTASGLHTHSRALFSHFIGVQPWRTYLQEAGISTRDYPYHPDHSALHHLLHNGWMWMLRFNDDRASAGFLFNSTEPENGSKRTPKEEWKQTLARYPSLQHLFRYAEPAADPGHLIQTGRLQRRLTKAAGDGWAALPHTAGFVDPLHSTGIAHTLAGVEKLLQILPEVLNSHNKMTQQLHAYEKSVFEELELIDLLVAGCYRSLPNFRLFTTYTMLYFIAAITYEQKRLAGEQSSHFLSAGDPAIMEIVKKSFKDLNDIFADGPTERQILQFEETVKKRIAPYNIAGLLNPEAQNMYHHTAVSF